MSDLNARVEQISPEQLDAFFSDAAPVATPQADNLLIGSQVQDTPLIVNNNSTLDVPTLDLDNIDAGDETDENKDKPDEVTDKNEGGEETSQGDDKKEETEDNKEPNAEQEAQVKEVLKNTVNYLVEKGLWKDFDGREDLDIDSETYAELAARQEEAKIDEMFAELLDTTGDYGKAIISHIKNGGNPDEVIDIFKEQKQVQNIDISDEDGAISLIEKYYSEEVGWSKAKIERYINGLKGEEDGLTEEAKELQSKYDKIYSQQVQQIQDNGKKQLEEKKRIQEEYINTLSQTIDNFENFTDSEKKLVKNSILKFNKKLDDGTPVNDFYLKFYEIQRDPKEYVDLIHFVMDKKGYQEKFNKKADTKATDKAFNFIKGNGAVKKAGTQIAQRDTSKTFKTDFSGLLKQK